MDDEGYFADLIRRVRAGDEEAAAALVKRFEPAIRRVVRLRLADSRLRRHLDSMDICQSVLASFFVRAALGQYRLDRPEELVKLLAVMARNKVADQARKPRLTHPEHPPGGVEPVRLEELAAPGPSPSRQLAARDLLDRFRALLSEDERRLADLRALGREWTDIAAELGGNPEALRKKLARAIDRVAQTMGLDE
jgi:RNA polymerase sigma-70 factor (ECF subfamily)